MDVFEAVSAQLRTLEDIPDSSISTYIRDHHFQIIGLVLDNLKQNSDSSESVTFGTVSSLRYLVRAICKLLPNAAKALNDFVEAYRLNTTDKHRTLNVGRNTVGLADEIVPSSTLNKQSQSAVIAERKDDEIIAQPTLKERHMGDDVEKRMQKCQQAHAAWRQQRYARESVLFDAFVAVTASPVDVEPAGSNCDIYPTDVLDLLSDTTGGVLSPYVPFSQRHSLRDGEENVFSRSPSQGTLTGVNAHANNGDSGGKLTKIDADLRLLLNRKRQRVRVLCKKLQHSTNKANDNVIMNHVIDPRATLSVALAWRHDVLEFIAQDHACGRNGAVTQFRIYFRTKQDANTFRDIYDGARSYNQQFLRIKSTSTKAQRDEKRAVAAAVMTAKRMLRLIDAERTKPNRSPKNKSRTLRSHKFYDDKSDVHDADVSSDAKGEDSSSDLDICETGADHKDTSSSFSADCTRQTKLWHARNANASPLETSNQVDSSDMSRHSESDASSMDTSDAEQSTADEKTNNHHFSGVNRANAPNKSRSVMDTNNEISNSSKVRLGRSPHNSFLKLLPDKHASSISETTAPHISRRQGIIRPSIHISPRQHGRGTFEAVGAVVNSYSDVLIAGRLRLYLLISRTSIAQSGANVRLLHNLRNAPYECIRDDYPQLWDLATQCTTLTTRLRHVMKAVIEASGGIECANRHAAEVLVVTGQLSLDLESYVNSSILLQRAAHQYTQILDENQVELGDCTEPADSNTETAIDASIRLGNARCALLRAQMRFHMRDYETSNVLHQQALKSVRAAHKQWDAKAKHSALQKQEWLAELQKVPVSINQHQRQQIMQNIDHCETRHDRFCFRAEAICRMAMTAVLSSFAATCDAVKRYDTSAQLLQKAASDIKKIINFISHRETTVHSLKTTKMQNKTWQILAAAHHGESPFETFLPTQWLAWGASSFPTLPSAISTAKILPEHVKATASKRHKAISAFCSELHAARAGLLTRAAAAHKKLRHRTETRLCCAAVHEVYTKHLNVKMATHTAAQDNLLQLATCTAADGQYSEAGVLFRAYVDALLDSASESTTDGDAAFGEKNDGHNMLLTRQSIFLLSSPPERRKQYAFALKALVTIHTKLGHASKAQNANAALAHLN